MSLQTLLEKMRPFHIRASKKRAHPGYILSRPHPLVSQVNRLPVVLNLVILCGTPESRLGALKLTLTLFDCLFGPFDSLVVLLLFGFSELALGTGPCPFGRINLLFDTVVAALKANQLPCNLVSLFVPVYVINGRPRYNQGSPGFVD